MGGQVDRDGDGIPDGAEMQVRKTVAGEDGSSTVVTGKWVKGTGNLRSQSSEVLPTVDNVMGRAAGSMGRIPELRGGNVLRDILSGDSLRQKRGARALEGLDAIGRRGFDLAMGEQKVTAARDQGATAAGLTAGGNVVAAILGGGRQDFNRGIEKGLGLANQVADNARLGGLAGAKLEDQAERARRAEVLQAWQGANPQGFQVVDVGGQPKVVVMNPDTTIRFYDAKPPPGAQFVRTDQRGDEWTDWYLVNGQMQAYPRTWKNGTQLPMANGQVMTTGAQPPNGAPVKLGGAAVQPAAGTNAPAGSRDWNGYMGGILQPKK